jgi:hypothetical protein
MVPFSEIFEADANTEIHAAQELDNGRPVFFQ